MLFKCILGIRILLIFLEELQNKRLQKQLEKLQPCWRYIQMKLFIQVVRANLIILLFKDLHIVKDGKENILFPLA